MLQRLVRLTEKLSKESVRVYGKEHQLQHSHLAVPLHGLKVSMLLSSSAMEQASLLARVPGQSLLRL